MKNFTIASVLLVLIFTESAHAGFLDDAKNAIKEGYNQGRLNAEHEKQSRQTKEEFKEPENTIARMDTSEISEFTPSIKSSSDFDKHVQHVKSGQGKIVSDKQGDHVFLIGENLEHTTFSSIDGLKLKAAMQSGEGLLFPIYSYYFDEEEYPRLELNWDATVARYEFLTKVLKLKLLPIESTKKAHEALLKMAVYFNGGGWGYEMPKHLVQFLGQKPDYIVSGFGVQEWYMSAKFDYSTPKEKNFGAMTLQEKLRSHDEPDLDLHDDKYVVVKNQKKLSDIFQQGEILGRLEGDFITRGIYFESMDVLLARHNGDADLSTACVIVNIKKYKNYFDAYGRKVEYSEFIKNMKNEILNFGEVEVEVQQACARGFSIFEVVGHQQSKKLK